MMLGAAAIFLMLAPSFETLSKQAMEARDAKRLDEALGFYQKALQLKPDWDEGWWYAGSIAYDQDKYAECAPAFRRLTELKPELTPAWTMSGLCEYSMHNYDAALKSFGQTERLGFQEPAELAATSRLHYALVLTKTGSFEKAITILGELISIGKTTPEISVAAGIAGFRKNWLPSEVPEASREMVMKLGDAMTTAMEKDSSRAVAKFETAAREYPAEANIHFRFGAFLMKDSSEKGIAEINQALALEPSHTPALVGLTMIYLKRQQPQNARGYAERAVKASPGDFATHVALGTVLLALDAAAEAAKELETAVALAPDSSQARFSLAAAYLKLGRTKDAEQQRGEFERLKGRFQ
jgi:tetratricopeptide (TPR) repeat protein